MIASVFVGTSLDGFIARANGDLDWLPSGGGEAHGYEEFIESADVLKHVSARGFRHAYVDGGITIQRFLRAGLIDRLVVTRVPVLIGEGIPLFGPTGRDVVLRHVATRTYASGLVQSEYAIGG